MLRLYAERLGGSHRLTSEAEVATTLAAVMTAPPEGTPNPKKSQTMITRISRSLAVMAWVIKEAAGRCEVCSKPAPFEREDGTPFLEVHHLFRLADGGPDTVENAVAVCPNCHRHFHQGADSGELVRTTRARVPRLI